MTTQSNGNNTVVQGRLVWTTGSSIFEGKQKTDYNTNQPLVGQDGSPVIEYGFGLAIPKVDPATGQQTEEFTRIWEALHKEAFTLYPGGQLPPDFAMKFKDGDGIDHNGKYFAEREGYAGHIILTCTTRIPIKYFVFQGGNNVLVNEGIKAGDYVNVQLNIKAHPAKGQGKPGLYVNPSAVQLIQPGKEIINTPSGDQLFGQAAPSYAGQVVADQAPAMPQVTPLAPGVQAAAIMPQAAPAMPPAQAAPAPHYGVLPQTMQPGQAAPAMPQVTPVTPAQVHAAAVPGQPPFTPGMPQAAPAPAGQVPTMPGMPPVA